MSIWAVSGAAGYGKTYRLTQRLEHELLAQPLAPGQSVLALTFMHGARQRLDQRLRELPALKGRFDCVTVDGFARTLRERWRTLGASIGQPMVNAVDFDLQCKLAADLLDREFVGSWVRAGHPIIILDEAQDLDADRLRLLAALCSRASVLVAFDDFQCLDSGLRPSPVAKWLPMVCEVEVLQKPQRTAVPALLNAASSIRAGEAPMEGTGFKMAGCLGANQAAALLASTLQFPSQARSIAVITPALVGGYAKGLIEMVCTKPCGSKKYGPFPIVWESSESSAMGQVEALDIAESTSPGELLAVLAPVSQSGLGSSLERWVRRQRDVLGREQIERLEVFDMARRLVALQRAHTHRSDLGRRAMTVHQAKNREFDGVVVLWPHTVGGDEEAKRRLLYNAVTRARKWCKVITQGEGALNKVPFR
ncbi:ATP-binding domain-containing protein [Cupriavidus sp. CV2]|uniref:ATP-binding domain-containing protein n=1 Tax=Cupriavidus ulmosensis TaxID=3065913 RepID=UPI00296AB6DC|nr:ATP-binding domain-containing protein [Cupriavidus sp. CV2]MDW3688457.1 ATP-binding domain-containing protein [Cupriavidus sp. CV2]